jgi:hypothetical protein
MGLLLAVVLFILAYGWMFWQLKTGKAGKISRSESPVGFWLSWSAGMGLLTFMVFRVLPQYFA